MRTRSSSAGPLVVDREQREALAHPARTPARNFGSVITTVVPSPFSTTRP